jgi:hypothetical protein
MPPPAGYPSPYPAPVHRNNSGARAVWLLVVPALVIGIGAAIGIAVFFFSTVGDTRSMIDSITETPDALPSISIDIPPGVIPDLDIPDIGAPTAPQGPATPSSPVSVAGVGGNRSIACAGGDVSVSGVDNVVELTGTCGQVTVSGVNNEVRIEATGVIEVSGFDNVLTYRFGAPEISQSGTGNSVRQG